MSEKIDIKWNVFSFCLINLGYSCDFLKELAKNKKRVKWLLISGKIEQEVEYVNELTKFLDYWFTSFFPFLMKVGHFYAFSSFLFISIYSECGRQLFFHIIVVVYYCYGNMNEWLTFEAIIGFGCLLSIYYCIKCYDETSFLRISFALF